MSVIKFILVILLCIPVAFILYCFFNNLIFSIKKQQDKAERLRRNKEMFKETPLYATNKAATRGSKHENKKKKVKYIKSSGRRNHK